MIGLHVTMPQSAIPALAIAFWFSQPVTWTMDVTDIVEEVYPAKGDPIIHKHWFDAFNGPIWDLSFMAYQLNMSLSPARSPSVSSRLPKERLTTDIFPSSYRMVFPLSLPSIL